MSTLVPIGVAAREIGVHPCADGSRRDVSNQLSGLKAEGEVMTLPSCVILHLTGLRRLALLSPTLASPPTVKRIGIMRQVALLESYCAANGWTCEIITDIGSGLNYSKRGLKLLISRICSGELDRLVLSHKDRLLRFGAELVFSLCEHFSCEVVIINASEDSTFEEDLANDVIEIVTVFSARLYGSRSHKNRNVMEQLRKVAKEVDA